MSREVAIAVRNLQKEFVLSNTAIGSLKTLILWWKRRSRQTIHVLKGIDFDVYRGECVAIVGRNGAGKSTLLSLMAKIYKPTSGSIEVKGRIAPLLELGAGFHPDLSGADNVFFNGVVLGLTRKQVKERLAQIHEFSELGNHLYAPVRAYSSGMLARLGFAIAIHVDAEVLLVDEVLSVGDFEFQQKCLQRIAEFREKGGTVLLVSHSLPTVEKVADRCVWIQGGAVEMVGTPAEVLPVYRAKSHSDLTTDR